MLLLRPCTTLLALGLCVLSTPFASAQDAIDFAKMAPLVVEVLDENGKPVADATLYPYAMRAAEDQNGHGYWNDTVVGPPKMQTTDEHGKATIHYPVNIGSATRPLTTGMVSFSVDHTDFVSKVVHFELGPKIATVEMKAGCEIQLSAVDDLGQPIVDFGVVMAGSLAPSYWANDGQGGRRTRAASDGTWQTMLVKPQANGPTLFSGVLPLRVRPDQDVKIRSIKMLPGTKIIGNLSDNVPRPVKEGIAIVTCAPKPAGNSYGDENPSCVWHDWAAIREDGTFELESLPRGGEMQIIVVCDGWLSKTIVPPPKDNGAQEQVFPNSQVQGQIFELDKDDAQKEVTIVMEPTGTIELTVLDPDGNPLNEGAVGGSPNQFYLKGGATLLGRHYRSIEGIESQLLPPKERKINRQPRDVKFPFNGKLVDGKVTLKGFPIGVGDSLALMHPKFVFQGERGQVEFTLESAEPKLMTLQAVIPDTNRGFNIGNVLQQADSALKAVFRKAAEANPKKANK